MKTVLMDTPEIESSEQMEKTLTMETRDITVILDEKREGVVAIIRYPKGFFM